MLKNAYSHANTGANTAENEAIAVKILTDFVLRILQRKLLNLSISKSCFQKIIKNID